MEEIHDPSLFSECFWKFIKERVGVSRIYPTINTTR